MDRHTARQSLASSDQHTRLKAARFFQLDGRPDDLASIEAALRDEDVRWIRIALKDAIRTCTEVAEPLPRQPEPEPDDPRVPPEIHRRAFREATGFLVHEIRHCLGLLLADVQAEISDYSSSRTKGQIDRLVGLLDAIEMLASASEDPQSEEFDLAGWLRALTSDIAEQFHVETEHVGTSPLIVNGDRRLLEMIARNALVNAAEASLEAGDVDGPPQIRVSWGESDRDYWVAIADDGPGPPPGSHHAFEMSRTTKDGHQGMGLAIARAAIDSMSGEIHLTPRRSRRGATLEFSWPRTPAVSR